MCGFISVISRSQTQSPEVLRQGLKAIEHRGPDEVGIWQNSKRTVSFAHNRLSIIDLSTGQQPMTNHDASLVAVVNGEFYDYKRIRKECEDTGYRFKTRSDSEILLALYERYGVQCLQYLRGEFGFVLWDQRNQWVFAARDCFGVKPLFYTVRNDSIYFASEVKSFLAMGLPLEWDEESFYQTLHMMPLPNATLFKGVEQIRPAHYLVKSIFNATPHTQSYWDFNYPKEGERTQISDQEAIEGFRKELFESVRLRMEADVPVASYLSGGLDSCSLLGIAQSMSSKPVSAFTLTFSDQDYNEATQAEEMAKHVGAPFQAIPITQRQIADGMEKAIWHAERFFFNGHGVAKFYLSEAVRKAGFKVVLTGEGSDEIFGGYAHFRQDQILHNPGIDPAEREQMLDTLVKTNKISRSLLLASGPQGDPYNIVSQLGFVPGFMQSFSAQSMIVNEILSHDFRTQMNNRNPIHHVLNSLDVAGQIRGREKLDRSLYIWSKLTLPYYLLTILGDRMEMAHSIEGRVPFLDQKLVEYVVRLPAHMKIRGMTEKFVLREAAKPYITRTIYERQKHPFLAPPAMSDRGDSKMSQFIQDTLRSSNSVRFLNQKVVLDILDRALTGTPEVQERLDVLLMVLASANILQKQFKL